MLCYARRDEEVIHRYATILIVCVVSAMSIPLMLIPIFIFQFLTTYYFIMSIIGLAMVICGYLWLVQMEDVEGAGSICTACIMASGGGRRRIVAAAFQACGWLLFVTGVVVELVVDQRARVGNLLDFDALSVVGKVSAFLLSMHLSQATTLSLAIRASACTPPDPNPRILLLLWKKRDRHSFHLWYASPASQTSSMDFTTLVTSRLGTARSCSPSSTAWPSSPRS